MKVLVIGEGAREHAIVKALFEDKNTEEIYLLPQRPSIKEAKGWPSSLLKDWGQLGQCILKEGIELVIVGPEQPLVEGLGDFLRGRGILVFGPSMKAAQLEGSKIFAKEFMKKQGIPTASYRIVSSVLETLQASENFSPPYVLKADGLAGGKGVFICESQKDLEEKATLLFEKKFFGTAGEKALLEDFQSGQEMSVFLLTNGVEYSLLPVARDYKRLRDGQKGPNTGGMGAIAPLSVSKGIMEAIKASVIVPTLNGLREMGDDYKGVLYIGLMVNPKGAKVLEYNIRFGDPEAQVLLPLLNESWLKIFHDIAQGKSVSLSWKKNRILTCLVMSASGYPEGPVKGDLIEGFLFHKTPYSYFLHGGISQDQEGRWTTAGGRVLNAIAKGSTLLEARERAYRQAERISWKGIHYRKDIGLVTPAEKDS